MNEQSFEEVVSRIVEKNTQYDMEAYYFIREALDEAQKKYSDPNSDKRTHVTGRQLSEAIGEHALNEFGPMAFFVMAELGLHTTRDFGNIVYSLINEGVFGKSAEDKKEDFDNVFDFKEVFQSPYEIRPYTVQKAKTGKRRKTEEP